MKNKKNVLINDFSYLIIDEYKDGFIFEDFEKLYTDYFYDYDYILGDYSYNKLRLKGFYSEKNKNVKQLNNIKNYKQYLNDFCAIDAPYFLLQKQK